MKSFKQYLLEDEQTDRKYRQEAVKAFNNLEKAFDDISKEGSWDEYLKQWSNNILVIEEKAINEILGSQYENLMIAFGSQRNDMKAAFGFSRGQPLIAFFIMDSEIQDSRKTGEKFNYIKKKIHDYKNEFVHEFIHYLDWKRTGYRGSSVPSKSSITPMEDYVNNPIEFNAYYQQIATSIKENAEDMKKRLEKDKDDWKAKSWVKVHVMPPVEEAVKKTIKRAFPTFFVDNLNSKFMKKLEKRLARFYTETLKPMFEDLI